MTQPTTLRVFGVYLSSPVYNHIEDHLSETVGIIDVDSYFDHQQSSVARGDPAGEVTNIIVEDMVNNFASLYDAADFDAAQNVNHDEFKLLYLAAEPRTSADARELFKSAATIQSSDSRTVHTAIFQAAVERGLPSLSTEKATELGLETQIG